MNKLLSLLPLIGIILGFALIITGAHIASIPLVIAGLVIVHAGLWVFAIKYVYIAICFFSSILSR